MNSVVGGGIAVPQDWTPMRLSRGLIAMQDGTHGSFDRVPDGVPLLSAKNVRNEGLKVDETESLIAADDSASITANGFPKFGDVLLTIVGTVGRSTVYLEKGRLAFQRSVCFLRPDPLIDSHFLNYFLQSRYFQDQLTARSKSAAQAGVYLGDVAACAILRPPLDEQRQIAEYLDRETGKIDELIAKQEQLVVTLTERRQTVITHAVLRGLDSSAELKDSGLDVIGPIPGHWKVAPLKQVISGIEQGVSPEASSELADSDSWGVLKSGCVNGGTFSDAEHKRLPEDFSFSPSLAVALGDLLVSRASGSPSLVGSAAIVKSLRYRLILSDKTFRLRPKVGVDVRFIEQFMQSRAYREQVRGAISGAAGLANNLPMSSLKSFQIAIPPSREQIEIADFLDQKVGQIDLLATKAGEVILILRERRAALISAAVTGKIDLRSPRPEGALS